MRQIGTTGNFRMARMRDLPVEAGQEFVCLYRRQNFYAVCRFELPRSFCHQFGTSHKRKLSSTRSRGDRILAQPRRAKSVQVFRQSLRALGVFIAKSRARKLKFVEAIHTGLGCQFATHEYFSFGKQEIVYSPRCPASARGAYASSRTWGGMRWTQAVSLDERRCARTAKACGPGAPTLALRSRVYPADDGGKRARSPGRARDKP